MERAPTGIQGLDELIEGGFPRNASVLVTGTPGTAKTTLALQFLVNGILKHNENGLYFGPGVYLNEVAAQFGRYGYDLKKLQDEGRLIMLAPKVKVEEGEDYVKTLFDENLKKKIVDSNVKRIVIDSITLILMFAGEFGGRRRNVERIIEYLKDLGVTSILIQEKHVGGKEEIEYGMEEFVVDGIMYMQLIRIGNIFRRAITILKMKGTKHSMDIHPVMLEEGGIKVYSRDRIYQ